MNILQFHLCANNEAELLAKRAKIILRILQKDVSYHNFLTTFCNSKLSLVMNEINLDNYFPTSSLVLVRVFTTFTNNILKLIVNFALK